MGKKFFLTTKNTSCTNIQYYSESHKGVLVLAMASQCRNSGLSNGQHRGRLQRRQVGKPLEVSRAESLLIPFFSTKNEIIEIIEKGKYVLMTTHFVGFASERFRVATCRGSAAFAELLALQVGCDQ